MEKGCPEKFPDNPCFLGLTLLAKHVTFFPERVSEQKFCLVMRLYVRPRHKDVKDLLGRNINQT